MNGVYNVVNNRYRLMSYGHVLSRSVWLLVCPAVLSYDWQLGSIALVSRLADHRNIFTAALLTTVSALSFHVIRSITRKVCSCCDGSR